MRRLYLFSGLTALAVIALYAFMVYGRSYWVPMYQQIRGQRSLSEVLEQYAPPARERLRPRFQAAGVAYPPPEITLLALKDRAVLELWAETSAGPAFVHRYPIQGLSGHAGPKLHEGDRQVPEGIYRIIGLNPNSSYHLSMKLNYPNPFDLAQAEREGRTEPGSNIFIHGKAVSIGCLAMGDTAIEELFTLAADVGQANLRVAIAPSDPRIAALDPTGHPAWVAPLYQEISALFSRYPRPEDS